MSAAIIDIKVGKKWQLMYTSGAVTYVHGIVNGPNIKLGRPGQIVEIDESVFTHQGKVL